MGLLPSKPSRPMTEMSCFNYIIYGSPKIGKTTLASYFPNAVFLATEDGQNALECYRVSVDSWTIFLDTCLELLKGNHPFKTVVIDTIDNLWELCRREIWEKRGIEHESELAYGLGSELVRTEFFRALTKLSMLPYGIVIISHSVSKEVTTRTGTHERMIPSFKEKEQGRLLGMADFILFCDLDSAVGDDGKKKALRVIRTKTSESYVAGDRTGLLPESMPLSFDVFQQEFDAAISKLGRTTPRTTKDSADEAASESTVV
jgi:AAA domain